MPVSLGGMINEARIQGGPSTPPPRPRGRAPHMKQACRRCSSHWERAPHPQQQAPALLTVLGPVPALVTVLDLVTVPSLVTALGLVPVPTLVTALALVQVPALL